MATQSVHLPVCLPTCLSVPSVLGPLQPVWDLGVLQVSLVESAAVLQAGPDVVQVVWSSGAEHVIGQDHRTWSQQTTVLWGEEGGGSEVRTYRKSGV